ncbi:MAG: hypothetical protein V4738_14320 [Pseudomonadota bacterium]
MGEPDDLRERTLARLKAQLARVPASINGGSVQQVRAFKRFHADAMKLLANPRIAMQQLHALSNQADTYYQ